MSFTGTSRIAVFDDQAITLNASVESNMFYLGKCGPSTLFWGNVNATCSGGVTKTTITYKIADTPSGTFYRL